MIPAAVALGIIVIAVLLYVVSQAAALKSLERLVAEKVSQLADKATRELDSREKSIRELNAALADDQRKSREAAEGFKVDLGAVKTKIDALQELQGKVSELNDLLKPQQLRGELGEVIVKALIADKLPPAHYEEEYAFADGKKVEFVIRLDGKLIPVDSKLQLEDFRRMKDAPEDRRAAIRTEFKRKIRQKIDEVRNYIKPVEGTYNFALMVIPSEAVYYEVVAQKDFVEPGGLYEYACAQNVFLVSPLTFWAYLTVIAQGLQGLEIGRRAEEILASLETIAAQIQGFAGSEFRVLGDHLRNAKAKYDEASEKLHGIDQGLITLKRLQAEQPTEQGVAA